MGDRITLRVLLPGTGVNYLIPVVVRGSDRVSSLDGRQQLRDREFVFRGELLDQAHTFDDYDIQNNDLVVAVRCRATSADGISAKAKWMKATSDDRFEVSLIDSSDATHRAQVARLKDIRFIKAEVSPRRLRRVYRESPPAEHDNADTARYATIIPDSPAAPSCDPLPLPW